jgi:5-methyltetrahydrofolate--homocysteine methyltransferase
VLPPDDGRRDHIALFVVTAGAGVRERSEEWKRAGEFVKSHGIQALAIETAEGCAEWLHRRIREDWGFPDPPSMTMHDRFTSKYRGKRYSFGYPACPNLDDQQGIWNLLHPEDIGVRLTEGMMMEPEASVSALVFAHPHDVLRGVVRSWWSHRRQRIDVRSTNALRPHHSCRVYRPRVQHRARRRRRRRRRRRGRR